MFDIECLNIRGIFLSNFFSRANRGAKKKGSIGTSVAT